MKATDTRNGSQACRCPDAARFLEGNRMLEMTNENFARLLKDLTIVVGHRRNRILLYQFLEGRDQGFALFIWGRR